MDHVWDKLKIHLKFDCKATWEDQAYERDTQEWLS
jgi:hypothetical protein